MNFETLGVWVLALGAIATALAAIFVVFKRLWAIFGWKGSFWGWSKKFVDTVDVISTLPVTLKSIDNKIDSNAKKLTDHLEDAKYKSDILLKLDQQMTEVIYELKPNGGGSIADKVNRLIQAATQNQSSVDGLYAKPGESGTPGREDHR